MASIQSRDWYDRLTHSEGFDQEEIEEGAALAESVLSKIRTNKWCYGDQAAAIIVGLVRYVTEEELIAVLTECGVKI